MLRTSTKSMFKNFGRFCPHDGFAATRDTVTELYRFPQVFFFPVIKKVPGFKHKYGFFLCVCVCENIVKVNCKSLHPAQHWFVALLSQIPILYLHRLRVLNK